MRIYYNNQCIYFGMSAAAIIAKEGLKNVWTVRKSHDPQQVFMTFKSSNFQNLIIEGNEEETFNSFQQRFEEISAGGGIVWNEKNELLMIHRLGKWDLPKGKLDPGENLAECAVREVVEETGLKNINLVKIARPTYHIYNMNDGWILKHTAWYEMKAPNQDLVPQAEEDISQAVWVPKVEIAGKLENSYLNIIYLLQDLL